MSATTKHPYSAIHPVALRLVEALRPNCHRIELAGSLRRHKEMIGDIEIVAIPIRPTNLLGEALDGPTPLDRFLDSRGIQFAKRGQKYQQFKYGAFTYGAFTVDLFLATPATWGSVNTIRTGSADFTRWLVTSRPAGGACPPEVAFRDGRLHAHGRLLSTPEETDVFNALGLAYIPPHLRHGPIPDAPRIDHIWNYSEE